MAEVDPLVLSLAPPLVCVTHLSSGSAKAHPSDSVVFSRLFRHGQLLLPAAALTPSQTFYLSALHGMLGVLLAEHHASVQTRTLISGASRRMMLASASLIRSFVFGCGIGVVWYREHVLTLTQPLSHLLAQVGSSRLPRPVMEKYVKYLWRGVCDGLALAVTMDNMAGTELPKVGHGQQRPLNFSSISNQCCVSVFSFF